MLHMGAKQLWQPAAAWGQGHCVMGLTSGPDSICCILAGGSAAASLAWKQVEVDPWGNENPQARLLISEGGLGQGRWQRPPP